MDHRPRAAREGTAVPQLLPRACPGLPSDAPMGLFREEAASCRFTNLQIPLFRRKARTPTPAQVRILLASRPGRRSSHSSDLQTR